MVLVIDILVIKCAMLDHNRYIYILIYLSHLKICRSGNVFKIHTLIDNVGTQKITTITILGITSKVTLVKSVWLILASGIS